MTELQPQAQLLTKVHIDQQKYESPNPTTGAVLYILGRVAADLDLYRKAHGSGEDELIENGPEVVRLKDGDQFRSNPRKAVTIFVNGQKKVVQDKRLTFAEVVALAYPTPPTGENILFTVSYEDGPPANPQGSLRDGESVKLKNGMIFNVTATDKS